MIESLGIGLQTQKAKQEGSRPGIWSGKGKIVSLEHCFQAVENKAWKGKFFTIGEAPSNWCL